MTLAELHDYLTAAGVPVVTVRRAGDSAVPVYAPEATDQQRAAGDALAAAWSPPTAAEESRSAAEALTASGDPARVLFRAVLVLIMQSIGETRLYLAQVRQQVLNLGGTLPPAPVVRTWDQLQDAVRQMIAAGAGDAPAVPPGGPSPPPGP